MGERHVYLMLGWSIVLIRFGNMASCQDVNTEDPACVCPESSTTDCMEVLQRCCERAPDCLLMNHIKELFECAEKLRNPPEGGCIGECAEIVEKVLHTECGKALLNCNCTGVIKAEVPKISCFCEAFQSNATRCFREKTKENCTNVLDSCTACHDDSCPILHILPPLIPCLKCDQNEQLPSFCIRACRCFNKELIGQGAKYGQRLENCRCPPGIEHRWTEIKYFCRVRHMCNGAGTEGANAENCPIRNEDLSSCCQEQSQAVQSQAVQSQAVQSQAVQSQAVQSNATKCFRGQKIEISNTSIPSLKVPTGSIPAAPTNETTETSTPTTEAATTAGTRTSVNGCYAFLNTCFSAPDNCSLVDPIKKLFDCLIYPHVPANCYRCDAAVMAIFSAEIKSLQFCDCSKIALFEGRSQDVIKYLCFVNQTCNFSIPTSTQEIEISTPSTPSLKVPTGIIPAAPTNETTETSTPTTEAATTGQEIDGDMGTSTQIFYTCGQNTTSEDPERCCPLIPEYEICRARANSGGYQFRIVRS